MTMTAAYTRVSTADQEAHGTHEVQRESIEKFCAYKNIAIDTWYFDQESGASVDRQDFTRLMESVRLGITATVVVYALDRFSRSQIETLQAIDVIIQKKASFFSVRDNISIVGGLADFGAQLMISILSLFAKNEREIIRSRTVQGRSRKTRQGLWVQGQPPAGYELDRTSKILRINDAEAALVRHLFDLRASGLGMNSIVKKLTLENVPFFEKKITFYNTRFCKISLKPRRSRYCRIRHYQSAFHVCKECSFSNGGIVEDAEVWSKTSVTRMLKNRVYVGMIRTSEGGVEHWIQGQHEPIINAALFDSIQTLIREHTFSRKRAYVVNPLAGLVFCKSCGRKMHVTTGGHGRRSKVTGELLKDYTAFRCPNRKMGLCSQGNIRTSVVYAMTYGWVDLWLKNPDTRQLLNSLFVILNQQYYSTLDDRILELRKDIARLDIEISKLNKGYVRAVASGIDENILSSGILKELKGAQQKREASANELFLCEQKRSPNPFYLSDVYFRLMDTVARQWSSIVSGGDDSSDVDDTGKQFVKTQILQAFVEKIEVSGQEVSVKMKFVPEMLLQPFSQWITDFIQLGVLGKE